MEVAIYNLKKHLEDPNHPYDQVVRYKHTSGRTIWVRCRGIAIRNKDGKAIRMLGAHQNVTKLKEIQERFRHDKMVLEAQNMLLEKLPNQIPGVIYTYRYHPDGRNYFPYASTNIYDIYEVTPDDVKEDAKTVLSRIHPDDYQPVMDSILDSFHSLNIWEKQYRVVLPEKGERWVQGIAKPEKLEDDSVLWYGYITDVTDKRQVEKKLESTLELFKIAEDIGDVGSWSYDVEKNIFTYSSNLGKMLDLDQKITYDLKTINQMVIEKDRKEKFDKFSECLKKNIEYVDNLVFNVNGKHKTFFTTAKNYINDGAKSMYIGFMQDISKRVETENKLKTERDLANKYRDEALTTLKELTLNNQKFNLLLESASDIVFTVNKSMLYTDAYGESLEKIGFKEVDYINKQYSKVFGPQYWPERKAAYEKAFNGQVAKHTWKYQSKDKTIVYDTTLSPLYDINNHIVGAVGVSRDITELYNKYEELEYIGNHDFLTGLKNRRFFTEKLKAFDQQKLYPFAILNMDINGLKTFNDVYGHDTGDLVIKKIAEVLKKEANSDSVVARIGGDEFAIILPNSNEKNTVLKRDHIIDLIKKETVENIGLSASIGYFVKKDDSLDLKDAQKLAENDMFKHKVFERNSNRNRAIQAIFKALTEKYLDEKIHSQLVSSLSESIGLALGMDKDQVKFLKTAAIFHDIGKIAVPDSVLKKPGKLTEEEFETIKTHTEIGYQILSTADQYSDLAKHALYHHERWDGNGYPKGLKEDEIPLISRIICIADAYQAMTSDRVYKTKISEDDAVREIVRCSGTQFDPKICRVFVEKVLRKQWDAYL